MASVKNLPVECGLGGGSGGINGKDFSSCCVIQHAMHHPSVFLSYSHDKYVYMLNIIFINRAIKSYSFLFFSFFLNILYTVQTYIHVSPVELAFDRPANACNTRISSLKHATVSPMPCSMAPVLLSSRPVFFFISFSFVK